MLGKKYELGTTIHCSTVEDDMIRIVVVDVVAADAPVPVPTDEVETVGQAVGQFIRWPAALVRSLHGKVVIIIIIKFPCTLC